MSISTESSPFIITKQSKGYFYEFKWLFKNAIPLVISYLLQNSLQSVGILNAGHLVN
jgi:MATE family multidrug resistance protein